MRNEPQANRINRLKVDNKRFKLEFIYSEVADYVYYRQMTWYLTEEFAGFFADRCGELLSRLM
jgi:hypothetical protein